MEIKTKLLALAAVPALSMLATVALAGDLDTPDPTPGTTDGVVLDGVIKNKNQCGSPEYSFFKNQFPALTNGNLGGCKTEILAVGDKNIPMEVCWGPLADKGLVDNAFEISLDGGVVHRLGVSVDTNDWIYDFDPAVFNERIFNFYADGRETAGDVAHLDICMEAADTDAPVISEIIVVPIDDDQTTVTGVIEIIASITDESDQNVEIELLDSAGNPVSAPILGPDTAPCASGAEGCTTYTWSLDTGEVPEGDYTIKVTSTDATVFGAFSVQTKDITIERTFSLSSCFGLIGDEDFDPDNADIYGDGCQITTMLNVQAAPDVNPVCLTGNPPPQCSVAGYQYEPKDNIESLGCDACVTGYCGPNGLPDTRMFCDGTLDPVTNACSGEWKPGVFEPLHISDVAKDGPEGPVPGTLGSNVFGYKGCFVGSRLSRLGPLEEQYLEWPSNPATGLVWTLTYSLKESLNPDVIVSCNLGGEFASQGGYQPIGKTQSVDTTSTGLQAVVLSATQECRNPPRTITRDNGVDVGNVYETDGSDDFVAFKFQQAQEQFDAILGPALECAGGNYIRGPVKFSDVTSPIKQAQSQFKNGTVAALVRAREDLQDAACAIRAGKWEVTAENCPGDLLSRVENAGYRMKDLIVALDPLFNVDNLRESPCLITDPAN